MVEPTNPLVALSDTTAKLVEGAAGSIDSVVLRQPLALERNSLALRYHRHGRGGLRARRKYKANPSRGAHD